MPADEPSNNHHEPKKGLPTVVPPSGGHIVQLFVVPGAIVVGVVVVLLGCTGLSGWFFGFSNSADSCLKRMREANPDVRWRAANDLAQILKRDQELASNPKVGLDLAELLSQAIEDLDREEKAFGDRRRQPRAEGTDGAEKDLVPSTLKSQRKFVQFLSACMGTMSVPVGAPLLAQMVRKDTGEDSKTTALLRRDAVWALANLGENRKQYDALSAARKEAILAELQAEAEKGVSSRARWARSTLNALQGKEDFGVVPALADCASAKDPDLRKLVSLAFTFWPPSAAEKETAERALLKLSGPEEHGDGERVLIGKDD